ncbi:hypothetical protein V8B97DRAFT_1994521 [Scleroderma yunnanense]
MAQKLQEEFDSPIFSALSDVDNLAVTVGPGSQLIALPTDEPPFLHFVQVSGSSHYEISIYYRNTLVEGREVVAIPGGTPQKWILEFQPKQNAFIIKQLPIWPSRVWNVDSDKKISMGWHEVGEFPRRMLFRIPLLEQEGGDNEA